MALCRRGVFKIQGGLMKNGALSPQMALFGLLSGALSLKNIENPGLQPKQIKMAAIIYSSLWIISCPFRLERSFLRYMIDKPGVVIASYRHLAFCD